MSPSFRVPIIFVYAMWGLIALMMLRRHHGETLAVLSACGLAWAVVRLVLHRTVPAERRGFHEAWRYTRPWIEFVEAILASPIYLLFGGVLCLIDLLPFRQTALLRNAAR